LVNAETASGNTKKVSLTPAGKSALKKLDAGESVNALTLGTGSSLA